MSPTRNDRIMPATRWTAILVTPVLVAAGIILYGFPGSTARLWAWIIAPEMTALTVGGGYLAGAVFFARASVGRRWSPVGLTFFAAAALTTLLLVATVIHWDRFNHGHVSFWAWALLYVVTPLLLPGLWAVNRHQDPGTHAGPEVPRGARMLFGVAGLTQILVALAIFVAPGLVLERWPWTVSPLTARTIAAFIVFVGVVWCAFLWESRWSSLRLHVQSVTLGIALVALGALRVPDDFGGPTWSVALFAVLLVGTLALLIGFQTWMWGRARERSPNVATSHT